MFIFQIEIPLSHHWMTSSKAGDDFGETQGCKCASFGSLGRPPFLSLRSWMELSDSPPAEHAGKQGHTF